ncbi:MAG: SDR family NAD(P)-dependent oxidoreductase [Anaerolineales bacterium]|nr:SDR family NAD(P)-dependent oxidoreductase [Anaerolineales bacterium]
MSENRVPRSTPLKPRQRALIIGASSGMGAALARRMAREGFTLALLARRDDKLKDLCVEINQEAGETCAIPYVHDATDYKKVPVLLRKITAALGGLDVVIYAAGVIHPPGMENYDFEKDQLMIETNLLGAMAWLNPVAAMFQNAKSGQIVGISSVAGDRGRVGNPGYNTSKAGLSCYLEALRNRLSRQGVNVLTIKPGMVKTDMLNAVQKVMFPISAEKAADDIWKAMQQHKQTVYTPWFWKWMMLVIQHIPSIIFRRLSF